MATLEHWKQAAYRMPLRPGAEPPPAPSLTEGLFRLALSAMLVFITVPIVVAALTLVVGIVVTIVCAFCSLF